MREAATEEIRINRCATSADICGNSDIMRPKDGTALDNKHKFSSVVKARDSVANTSSSSSTRINDDSILY
ncbi:unnamed protein product [Onchocerca flexuosa]|uniref:Uncharacterized protein n=1 Tax=Onchocerca flexuosa TaxID=387005 RepID=A0A183HCW8_9BILA|nr:unnamed protein product [Onchocerca flexuosa]